MDTFANIPLKQVLLLEPPDIDRLETTNDALALVRPNLQQKNSNEAGSLTTTCVHLHAILDYAVPSTIQLEGSIKDTNINILVNSDVKLNIIHQNWVC